jgi:RNA polymerase sigma-70 factor (ECF subfamily)
MFYGWKLGDGNGFSRLYSRYRKPISRYVSSRIANNHVAEELTQEVFFKAYRYRESYQERYALSTWLWTIAKNTVADYLRGMRESADDGFSQMPELTISPDDLPTKARGAEELLLTADRRRALLDAIKILTRLQKRVLFMRLIRQLSYEEIARRLGISLSAAKNLAHRAKLKLMGHLELAEA